MIKKVLIIGHFWPYRGGSKRMLGLAKYLKNFGWEPIVITGPIAKKPDFDIRYVEVGYRNIFGFKSKADFGQEIRKAGKKINPNLKNFLRRFNRYFFEIFAYPDESKYWKLPAIKEIKNILKHEKIDAVISVWPVTSHIIAKEIKNKFNIPWVADFPDLWSQNYNYQYGKLRKYFDKKLEKKTIVGASAITTVSDPLAEDLKKIHKNLSIFPITLGFDEEKIKDCSSELSDKFVITYTGTVYKNRQNLSIFFSAIRDLISEKIIDPSDVAVKFFGPKSDIVAKNAKRYNLENIVKEYGEIPHQEAMAKQKGSQLLLLLNWEDKKAKGVYTGKIFEYLAAERPIIATGGFCGDVIEKLIEDTNAGVCAVSTEKIKKALAKFYFEFKEKGKVEFRGDKEEIKKYSFKEMAKKFSELLDKII